MRGKNILLRLIITITIAALFFGGMMCFTGGKGFFGKISNGMKSYNTITESELKKNQPLNGTIYYIYDCIGYEYTEDDDGNKTPQSYYYTVPFQDNKVLIVKTDASSSIETEMDQLLFAPDYEEYSYLLETGVDIEGLLVKNDPDVVEFFNKWRDDQDNVDIFKSDYNIDISNFEPVDYTFDLSIGMSGYTTRFFAGAVILAVTIGCWVAFFVIFFKGGTRKAQPANAYNQPYAQQNFGTAGLGAQPNLNAPGSNAPSSFIPQQSNSFADRTQAQGLNNTQNVPAPQFGQAAAPQNGISSYIPQQSSVSNYLPNQANSANASNQQGFSANAGFIPAQTNSLGNSSSSFNAQPTGSFNSSNSSFGSQPINSFNSSNSSFGSQPTSSFNAAGSSFNSQRVNLVNRNNNSQQNNSFNTNAHLNTNLNNKTVIASPQAAAQQQATQPLPKQEAPRTTPQQSAKQTSSVRKDGNRVVISRSFIAKKKDTDANNKVNITKHQ